MSIIYKDGIYYGVGGIPDILANKFNRSDLYNTNEKIIGRWTDGKPLYQKTFNVVGLPNASTKYVDHNIIDLDHFVYVWGIMYNPTSKTTALFNHITPDANSNVYLTVTATQLQFTTMKDRRTWNAIATVRYTKITDSAIAIGDDTDYSTTEKIVGTWVDDKPIYQRTIHIESIPVEKDVNKYYGINGNITDHLISYTGFVTVPVSSSSTLEYPFGAESYNDAGTAKIIKSEIYNNTANHTLLLRFFQSFSSATVSIGVDITIQYTKTTD